MKAEMKVALSLSTWIVAGAVAFGAPSKPVELHVAPEGADHNPGTQSKPLKTLAAARDALRSVRPTSSPDTPAIVVLYPGAYDLTETFALDGRDSYTTYKSHPSAEGKSAPVRLSGGRAIPPSAVQPVADPAVLGRVVEAAARPHLRQIDLKALGIVNYGELGPRGFRRAYIPAPLELFVDGKAQEIARWPNAGEKHVRMGKVIAPGSNPRGGDYSGRGGTFKYDVARPANWRQAKDFYISGIFHQSWADDTIQVAKLDTEQGTFTTKHPHLYGFKQMPFTAWYALNLLEEIDRPGEYYVDKETGVLTFYPPAGFSSKSRIEVSQLDQVMVAIEGATDVRFEGIVFEVARNSAVYIERGSGNALVGCTMRNLGELAVQIGQGTKPYPYGKHDGCGNKEDGKDGEAASWIMGSWHEWIYKDTAWNRLAGTNHQVISCDIYDCGAGGISLGGGDRKTLTPGKNAVIDCDIYRVNRWDRTYKAPVNIDGVGNRVAHCHLHDVPGLAIYLHGNDHVLEYNEIDHVLTDMSDMGAIYMGRDPSEAGSVFRYNFFHDIKNFHQGGAGVQAIFFDDCSIGGAEIYGNVFYRTGSTAAIKFNGGGACDIHDNVFVDCPQPLQGAGDNTGGVRGFMHGALGKERLLKRVNITQPPYSEKYPRLLAIYQGKAGVTTSFRENYVVKGDYTAFADVPGGDFTIPNPEIVKAKVPGFNVPPFGAMGLRKERP